MKLKFFIGGLILFMLNSCTVRFEKEIENYLNNYFSKNDTNVCVIDIKNFTDFEWDKMYIVEDFTPCQDIYDTIGFVYKGCSTLYDWGRRVIFVKDQEIVYKY